MAKKKVNEIDTTEQEVLASSEAHKDSQMEENAMPSADVQPLAEETEVDKEPFSPVDEDALQAEQDEAAEDFSIPDEGPASSGEGDVEEPSVPLDEQTPFFIGAPPLQAVGLTAPPDNCVQGGLTLLEEAEPDGLEPDRQLQEGVDSAPTEQAPPLETPSAEEGTDLPSESQGVPSDAAPVKKTRARRKKAAEAEALPEKSAKKESAKAEAADRPTPFLRLNLHELDRDLSPDQRREWEAIYASYRSKSILAGTVTGSEVNYLMATNRKTGERERRKVLSLIVIGYRVKIMIPEPEAWMDPENHPDFVTRHMAMSKIEFVITHIDREHDCAVASRRLALMKRRRQFEALQSGHRAPERIQCNVLSVGPTKCLVECGGYDLILKASDLSWSAIPDLRSKYHSGDVLDAKIKSFSAPKQELVISVKEVNPNPFDGADQRHPVGCQRQAVISGKYKGGIFCTLTDSTVCMCIYSNKHIDTDFQPGDNVIVYITQYDYKRKQIYGRIMTKL